MLAKLLIVASLVWTSSAFASLAAISYSPSTAHFGYAAGSPDANYIRREAIRACGISDCEVAGIINNGYLALARDRRGNVYVGSSHRSREGAYESAFASCGHGRGCIVFAWVGAMDGAANCPPVIYNPTYPSQRPPAQRPSAPPYQQAPYQQAPTQRPPAPRQSPTYRPPVNSGAEYPPPPPPPPVFSEQ